MNYLRFQTKDVYDFKNLILANVSEQLIQIEEAEDEEDIICIGALNENGPQGAVVAQLLGDHEVFIHSIFVNPSERKNGVAKELLNSVLSEALAVFSEDNDFEESAVDVFLHTDYALPTAEIEAFTGFLKSFGFSDFANLGDCYLIEKNNLKEELFDIDLSGNTENENSIESFADLSSDGIDLLNELIEDSELQIDPSLSFVLGSGEIARAYMWTELGADDEFVIRSSGSEDITDAEFLGLLKITIDSIAKANKDFTLILDSESNLKPDLLAKQFGYTDCCFKRTEAGMYILFE